MFSPFARNQVGKNTFCETITHHEYWHFTSAKWVRRNFPGCSKKSIVEWNDGSRRIIRLVWNFLMVKRFSSTADAMCTPTPERNMTNIVRSYHLRGRLWRRWQSSSCKTFVFGSLFWLLLSISFTLPFPLGLTDPVTCPAFEKGPRSTLGVSKHHCANRL